MIKTIFAEIPIGKDFTWDGELYQKVSYDSAYAVSYLGDEIFLQWNCEVEQTDPDTYDFQLWRNNEVHN